jgi:hypothetical protein
MSQSQQQQRPNNLVFIEWDTVNGWEKYLVTYDQALSLIPILAAKVPSITITDYEYYKIQRDNFNNSNGSTAYWPPSDEGYL